MEMVPIIFFRQIYQMLNNTGMLVAHGLSFGFIIYNIIFFRAIQ